MPQFDFLFQPMLIALAASIGLVSARLWGGRGAALGAVAFFVVVRGFVSLMVAGVWDESVPHFPLYLVEALLVEGAAVVLLKRGPLTFGAVAGLLIGTVGTAAEWAWSHVWMPLPWPTELLPEAAAVTVLAGLGGGPRRRVRRQLAARQAAAVPARRARRLPARRAASWPASSPSGSRPRRRRA